MTPDNHPPEQSISIIIPTWNEVDNIGSLITELQKNGGNRLAEIIVVDGGSIDNTKKEAEKVGAVVMESAVKSRAAQMNLGAKKASGDIFYFVHADVKVPSSYTKDILEAVHKGYVMGSYRTQFDSPEKRYKFNAWCTRFKLIFCRGGDQTLFVTRKQFEALNGFDENYVIMEDYDIIQRSWRKSPFYIIPKTVTVSTRKYRNHHFLRVNFTHFYLFMMYFAGASPRKMAMRYSQLLKNTPKQKN